MQCHRQQFFSAIAKRFARRIIDIQKLGFWSNPKGSIRCAIKGKLGQTQGFIGGGKVSCPGHDLLFKVNIQIGEQVVAFPSKTRKQTQEERSRVNDPVQGLSRLDKANTLSRGICPAL